MRTTTTNQNDTTEQVATAILYGPTVSKCFGTDAKELCAVSSNQT
jgi:hypothetical protein